MASYPTPHIHATPEDFGKTVLMPGDPLRAKFIAENFLEAPRLVNNVRGIQGYTGTYKGVKVSVMASGMGMPSIGIYSYELYHFFGVENIIRVGSAGALQTDVKVRDMILGMGASTNSAYGAQYNLGGTFAPLGSYALLKAAATECEKLGARGQGKEARTCDLHGLGPYHHGREPGCRGKAELLYGHDAGGAERGGCHGKRIKRKQSFTIKRKIEI